MFSLFLGLHSTHAWVISVPTHLDSVMAVCPEQILQGFEAAVHGTLAYGKVAQIFGYRVRSRPAESSLVVLLGLSFEFGTIQTYLSECYFQTVGIRAVWRSYNIKRFCLLSPPLRKHQSLLIGAYFSIIMTLYRVYDLASSVLLYSSCD